MPDDTETEFSLPEQRIRHRVAFGGISAWHVVVDSTFPSARHPGRWTRRAWDRRALCGAMGACVVGGDASEWPIEPEPVELGRVTCKRCLDRAALVAAKGCDGDETAGEERA